MTISLPSWLNTVEALPGPKYQAIAQAIADAVENGELKPLDRLPPQRELAWALSCTVGTISRAYAEAERRGLLDGEVGRGTYIRDFRSQPANDGRGMSTHWHSPSLEHATARDAASMDAISGWPHDAGPALRETGPIRLNHDYPPLGVESLEAARTIAELASDPILTEMLSYQPPAGLSRHRAVGASWIARQGVTASEESVVVSSGAHSGVLACLSAITRPGDAIAVEMLTYPGIKAIAGMLGLALVPLPLDEEGLIPDALDDLCGTKRIAALYTVPTLQNPTNAIMSEERRKAIGDIAAKHGLPVVEDDVFGMLVRNAPKALSAYLPESQTFYVNSISKSLAPGLRIGFVKAPLAQVGQVAAAQRTTNWMASPFTGEIAARWIESGAADRILDSHLRNMEIRRTLTLEALEGLDINCPEGALHAWVKLPERWRVGELIAEAQSQGVVLPPTDSFMIGGGETPHAVRLSYCPPRHQDRLKEALDILQTLLLQGSRVEAAHIL